MLQFSQSDLQVRYFLNSNNGPPRVLIASPFDGAGVARLQEVAEVDHRPALRGEKLEAAIGDYNALIIDSETPVPDRTIEYAYQLHVIGVAGASLIHLGVSAARAQGVEVINVPDPRTLALAEQTFGLMLNMAYQDGGQGLANQTLGIVGFRDVGREIAERARSFRMRVVVHQPRLTSQLALEAGVELFELHELLEISDYVSLHLPSTPETRGLIGPNKLSHLSPQAYIVNAGSLNALDMQALLTSLETGRIRGAALVLPSTVEPEISHPKLVTLPRQMFESEKASRDIALKLAKKIVDRLHQRRAANPLSLRVVPLDRVLPHENYDPVRVNDLAQRLSEEATLVNPPLVVEWAGNYVVLDGATRSRAFKQLKYPHIVVQLISPDDQQLSLHTWYHAVCGPATDEMIQHLEKVPTIALKPAPSDKLQKAVDTGEALCSLIRPDGTGFLAREAAGTSPLKALNDLVAAYTEVGSITRTLNTDLRILLAEVPDVSLLVIFPQFTLLEVLDAATVGELLPSGITRFVIPGRILRLHADLERLKSDEPLALKNTWLNQMLADKMARRRVRFYQEPVILMDE